MVISHFSTSVLLSELSFETSSSSCIESPPKSVREDSNAGSLAVSSRGTNRDNFVSFFGPIILKTNKLLAIQDQFSAAHLDHKECQGHITVLTKLQSEI